MKIRQIQPDMEQVETRTIKCKFDDFLNDLVGVEKTDEYGCGITSLDAEIKLEFPRMNEPTEHCRYEVVVSVDYGDHTKLTFAAKDRSDLWFQEKELLRGAFSDHSVAVNLDFYVDRTKISDRYNVPKVFGKVVQQAIDDLIEKISLKDNLQ